MSVVPAAVPASAWSVARINRLRQLDVKLRKSARTGWITIAWALVIELIALSQLPRTDAGGVAAGSAGAFAALSTAAALIMGFGARRLIGTWLERRRTPEAAVVTTWVAAAGGKVVTTVLAGGPKLGVDVPISGESAASTAMNVGTFGGGFGHPLLAAGVMAVSGLVNGAAYLKGRPARMRAQAALKAEYQSYSRRRVTELLDHFSTVGGLSDFERSTLRDITRFALNSLPLAPVSFDKGSGPTPT